MIEIITAFEVKEAHLGQFELVFGRGGAWSRLFAAAPGFRGATLLRDADNPLLYLRINIWDSPAAWAAAQAACSEDYAQLEAELAAWTTGRTELGVFQIRAQTTVQPPPRPGRKGRSRRAGR